MLRYGVAFKPLGRFVTFAALAFVTLFYPVKIVMNCQNFERWPFFATTYGFTMYFRNYDMKSFLHVPTLLILKTKSDARFVYDLTYLNKINENYVTQIRI